MILMFTWADYNLPSLMFIYESNSLFPTFEPFTNSCSFASFYSLSILMILRPFPRLVDIPAGCIQGVYSNKDRWFQVHLNWWYNIYTLLKWGNASVHYLQLITTCPHWQIAHYSMISLRVNWFFTNGMFLNSSTDWSSDDPAIREREMDRLWK